MMSICLLINSNVIRPYEEHEYDTDAEFMYEISDDVEHIQHHLQEVFVQGEEEYELCERGDSERAVPIGGHILHHYLIHIMR